MTLIVHTYFNLKNSLNCQQILKAPNPEKKICFKNSTKYVEISIF